MSVDVVPDEDDRLLPLVALPDMAGDPGDIIPPPRAYQWTRRGLAGVILPSFWIGGRRFVMANAYRDWLLAVDEAKRERTPRE
jgi:hypothetical protein